MVNPLLALQQSLANSSSGQTALSQPTNTDASGVIPSQYSNATNAALLMPKSSSAAAPASVPTGTAIASNTGANVAGGMVNAGNLSSASTAAIPPMVPSAVGTVPKPLQDAIDATKQNLSDLHDYIKNNDATRAQQQQAIQQMQSQMLSSPTPAMQKVSMNPLAALGTGLAAAAMQNRYTPQSEQFVSGLLGGMERNNQTDFQNQQLAHQNKMAVLGSAVQALRDETQNNRFADAGAMRGMTAQLDATMRDLTSVTNNQNTTVGRYAGKQIDSAAKNEVAQSIAQSQLKRQAYDAYTHAQGPAERIAALRNLQNLDPSLFAGLSDTDTEALLQLTPKEQKDVQQASLNQVKADTLPASLLAKEGLDNAKAKNALAQIDRIAHQNGWDDARSEEAYQHAGLFYKIIGNYDADHAATRAENMSKEMKNRMDGAAAITRNDDQAWIKSLKAATDIYKDQVSVAQSQQKALLAGNGNRAFADDDTSPSATAYRNLQHEIDGAAINLRGIIPAVQNPAQPLNDFQKGLFHDLYAGYRSPSIPPVTNQGPPPSRNSSVNPVSPVSSIKPINGTNTPAQVNMNGAILNAPLRYVGQMKLSDPIPGAGNDSLANVLAHAQAAIGRNPMARDQVISRLKGIGVTVQ